MINIGNRRCFVVASTLTCLFAQASWAVALSPAGGSRPKVVSLIVSRRHSTGTGRLRAVACDSSDLVLSASDLLPLSPRHTGNFLDQFSCTRAT